MKFPGNYRQDLGQFIKFNLVGVVNTGVDLGVFLLLNGHLGLFYPVAQVISYSCGMTNSYFCNRFWTFGKRGKLHLAEIAKFVLVNLLSLGVSLLVLFALAEGLGWQILPSKILATVFSVVVNFLGNKLWVFAVKGDSAS